MKIAIVVPPFINTEGELMPSLGVYTILSYLKENSKYELVVYDFPFFIENNIIEDINKIYLKCADLLIKSNCNIFSFSVNCVTIVPALQISKIVKSRYPNAIILFGGPAATVSSSQILNNFEYVDYCLEGEGEVAYKLFLDFIDNKISISGVSNLVYRDEKRIVKNPRFKLCDSILLADYSSMIFSVNKTEIIIPYEGGRGCTNSCSFCSTKSIWGNRIRPFTLEKIYKDIRQIKEFFHKKKIIIYFTFDNLLHNKKFMYELCDLLESLDIKWMCRGRTDFLDENSIIKLAKCGCVSLLMGIESANEKTWINDNKGRELPDFCKIVTNFSRHKITSICSFIIGDPHENLIDINNTLLLALKISNAGISKIGFHLLTPLFGTKMYNDNEVVHTGIYSDFIDSLRFAKDYQLLTEDVSLVRLSKEIFSAFYNIKNDLINYKALKNIVRFANCAFNTLAKTMQFLVNEEKINICQLIEEYYGINTTERISYSQISEFLLKKYTENKFLHQLMDFEKQAINLSYNSFSIIAADFDIIKYIETGDKIYSLKKFTSTQFLIINRFEDNKFECKYFN